ncbi:hypothetical protein FOXG_17824 [Fusarium oxysporum f. sp. lycopersici 4287]|uniref:Uncharacterized protein n=1 Tax=Fusarium oxysporum f. sp. lycopersici (strain 4287 / CBS 123668 / FGSC 9935 / NRRL 34936) TaxID=426428 RepID=A0A0J9U711_FUSO4|nr:hypothetical protein FOXG_17824 [Fusarium oxysporum f. sp. lycopersici 4287]KNA93860.1 hypothetical protein FOXG_17824 [Fusarium oxysporum f. sp. lycopersici 4287]
MNCCFSITLRYCIAGRPMFWCSFWRNFVECDLSIHCGLVGTEASIAICMQSLLHTINSPKSIKGVEALGIEQLRKLAWTESKFALLSSEHVLIAWVWSQCI